MGLSKGTLGLKFMNRQAPAAASTPPPSAAAAASTTTPATSKPADTTAPSTSTIATATATRKTGERAAKRNEWDSSSTGSRPSVVHETSLLSFPLLSTLNKSTNAGPSSSSSSMTATYSSMPLTSAMVSGRRSFGGANVEIEKLNDPSSHQAAPEKTADSSKSKTSSKRPKKADRDAALVESVRGGKNKSGSNLSGPKAGKRAADLERRGVAGGGEEEEEDGANKKKRRKTDELNNVPARWELDVDDDVASAPSVGRRSASGGDGERSTASSTTTTTKKATAAEFARPAGFDGVKKKQAKPAAGKGKGKGRMMDDEQYQWAKQGETREWDEGKSSQEEDETDSDSDSEEEEEERMVSSSSDEESSEEDEDDEEEEAIMADEQRFSEAADRAVGGRGGGGGHSGSRGGRAGSQSKSITGTG